MKIHLCLLVCLICLPWQMAMGGFQQTFNLVYHKVRIGSYSSDLVIKGNELILHFEQKYQNDAIVKAAVPNQIAQKSLKKSLPPEVFIGAQVLDVTAHLDRGYQLKNIAIKGNPDREVTIGRHSDHLEKITTYYNYKLSVPSNNSKGAPKMDMQRIKLQKKEKIAFSSPPIPAGALQFYLISNKINIKKNGRMNITIFNESSEAVIDGAIVYIGETFLENRRLTRFEVFMPKSVVYSFEESGNLFKVENFANGFVIKKL